MPERLPNQEQEKTQNFEPKVQAVGFDVAIRDELYRQISALRENRGKMELARRAPGLLNQWRDLEPRIEKALQAGELQPFFDFAHDLDEFLPEVDQQIDQDNQQVDTLRNFVDRALLTEEELAVIFARISRTRLPFEELAKEATAESSRKFHEKWTVSSEGFGHGSIADHAILHFRVDGFSSMAVDWITTNRLGGYTEYSARYQQVPPGYYYTPEAIALDPRLSVVYREAQDRIVTAYEELVAMGVEYLKSERAQEIDPTRRPNERESEEAYEARLRRVAQDHFKNLMTAARLSNVGVTVDARTAEHMISKFESSGIEEIERLGQLLKEEGLKLTPTLIKYAGRNEYLVASRQAKGVISEKVGQTVAPNLARELQNKAILREWDSQAEARFLTAFQYDAPGQDALWDELYAKTSRMTEEEKEKALQEAFARLGTHDALVRDAEFATDYLFEFLCDYGLLRELERHRMNSFKSKPLGIRHGFFIPDLACEMKETEPATIRIFTEAIKRAEDAHEAVAARYPEYAPYLVTRSHLRPSLFKMNFRQAFYFFRLRTGPRAHYTAQRLMGDAYRQAAEVHPLLWRHLQVVGR